MKHLISAQMAAIMVMNKVRRATDTVIIWIAWLKEKLPSLKIWDTPFRATWRRAISWRRKRAWLRKNRWWNNWIRWLTREKHGQSTQSQWLQQLFNESIGDTKPKRKELISLRRYQNILRDLIKVRDSMSNHQTLLDSTSSHPRLLELTNSYLKLPEQTIRLPRPPELTEFF